MRIIIRFGVYSSDGLSLTLGGFEGVSVGPSVGSNDGSFDTVGSTLGTEVGDLLELGVSDWN